MINLTDDLLRAAAADVRNAMLDALPAPEECRHTFSPQFERKMQKLIRKQKAGYRLLRQVAAVFLALLVGSGVWLMVGTEARATFLHWVQTVYENSIVYRFFGSAPAELELANYRPTWLPEGYIETGVSNIGWTVSTTYQNADGETIILTCTNMQDGEQTSLSLSDVGMQKPVSINGCDGIFYQAIDFSISNSLEWIDSENGVFFDLSGYCEESTMCRIAESVILDISTNIKNK